MDSQGTSPVTVQSTADGRQVLTLCGDVSVCISLDLHRECVQIARQGQDTIVCCTEVCSFDAAALQVLAALKEALTSQGRDFQLLGLSPELRKTVDSSGLKRHLAVSNTP